MYPKIQNEVGIKGSFTIPSAQPTEEETCPSAHMWLTSIVTACRMAVGGEISHCLGGMGKRQAVEQLCVHPPHPTALVLKQEPDYRVLIRLPHFTSLLGSDCCAHSHLASTRAVQALPSLNLMGWWHPRCHLGTGITFTSNLPGAWQEFTSECWPHSIFKSAHCLNLCDQ